MSRIEDGIIAGYVLERPEFLAETKPNGTSRAPLAAAAFLVGAVALVNPALADECTDTVDLVRTAASRGPLSTTRMHEIDLAIDRAVLRLDLGDDRGCLSELAAIRQALAN